LLIENVPGWSGSRRFFDRTAMDQTRRQCNTALQC